MPHFPLQGDRQFQALLVAQRLALSYTRGNGPGGRFWQGEMATQPGAQGMPLLRTRLYIPAPRPTQAPRPRLVERLDAGLGRKLTLVSAPAGFGKTTLLGEWVAVRAHGRARVPQPHGRAPVPNARSVQVAWLSLDEGDNDLTRFLTYLIAALQAGGRAGRGGKHRQ